MSIKTYRPTTPARRQMTVSGFDGVDKHARPEKSLVEVLKKHAGRNSYGHITVRHKGGGNRQKYRVIDFKRNKTDMFAEVLRLEYDPNRSAFIALVQYEDGEKRYILAPNGLKAGDKIVSGAGADIIAGNALPLANIPVGTVIHNIELYPGKGAQLVRSAGVSAQLMAKDNGVAQVRLPSGEVRIIRLDCKAIQDLMELNKCKAVESRKIHYILEDHNYKTQGVRQFFYRLDFDAQFERNGKGRVYEFDYTDFFTPGEWDDLMANDPSKEPTPKDEF